MFSTLIGLLEIFFVMIRWSCVCGLLTGQLGFLNVSQLCMKIDTFRLCRTLFLGVFGQLHAPAVVPAHCR